MKDALTRKWYDLLGAWSVDPGMAEFAEESPPESTVPSTPVSPQTIRHSWRAVWPAGRGNPAHFNPLCLLVDLVQT